MQPARGFRSDNNAGLCPEAQAALAAANAEAPPLGTGVNAHPFYGAFVAVRFQYCGVGNCLHYRCHIDADAVPREVASSSSSSDSSRSSLCW